MPATSSTDNAEPYVREAKLPEDFEAVVEVARKAFQTDPVFSFWGSTKEFTETGLPEKNNNNLRTFLRFILRCCADQKARFMVVVVPVDGREVFASAAIWVPPNERLDVFQVRRLLRAGIVSFFRVWGYTGFDRITTQYLDKCHHSFEEGFKKRGLQKSVDDTWYLNLAMTDPQYQGRSFMTMLLKEHLGFAPGAIYTLEATTPKVKDVYAHLGFELQSTFILGKGKAAANGLPATGDKAVGMEVFPMIMWPASPP